MSRVRRIINNITKRKLNSSLNIAPSLYLFFHSINLVGNCNYVIDLIWYFQMKSFVLPVSSDIDKCDPRSLVSYELFTVMH